MQKEGAIFVLSAITEIFLCLQIDYFAFWIYFVVDMMRGYCAKMQGV